MVKRKLPSASLRNPQLTVEHTPQHEILVERRRLGQTDLKAPGSSPAADSKHATVGIFDYAHLRVPLPADLKRSGIFTPLKNGQYPESYFLMRRSSDGYISSTGLYKAAYPYSSTEEEQAERKYHKGLPSGSGEEVAGNVWVSPEDAFRLADEYQIRPWLLALLDNEKIEVGSKEKTVGKVTSPPAYHTMKNLAPPSELSASAATPRARSKRSVSPAKLSATPRKIASPRKRRAISKQPEEKEGESLLAKAESTVSKAARKTSKSLQEKLSNGVGASPEAKTSKKDNASTSDANQETLAETVRVEVNETIETNDAGKEVSHTTVSVSMPASHPDLPLPEDTTKMIEKAKEMVEEANKLEKRVTKNAKRKASSSLTKADVEDAIVPAAKKPRTELQEKLVTERVRTRALLGLTATLVVGAVIPYFL